MFFPVIFCLQIYFNLKDEYCPLDLSDQKMPVVAKSNRCTGLAGLVSVRTDLLCWNVMMPRHWQISFKNYCR